jgi:hypothetical protein
MINECNSKETCKNNLGENTINQISLGNSDNSKIGELNNNYLITITKQNNSLIINK